MKSFGATFVFVGLMVLASTQSPAQPVDESSPSTRGSPVADYLPPPPPAEEIDTKLSNDGYRYKTVRKLKYRQRRDVSQEYLPPTEQPLAEYLPPINADTKLAEDGYQYKTVRQLKFRARHRRDVAELEQPVLKGEGYVSPVVEENASSEDPAVKQAVNHDDEVDGYRYRTVRRLKYRRHRREAVEEGEEVPEGSLNEYLPPAVATTTEEEISQKAAIAEAAAEVKSAELANDGYRYRTVRKLRYRYRH